MSGVENYLRLSSHYCDHLGGLRWSSEEDVIEFPHGRLFAFTAEIAVFLAGFASSGRLIHFAHLLHLLDLFRNRDRPFMPALGRLREAFDETGRPLRNAGVLASFLCRDVPAVPGLLDAREVCERLTDPARPIRWFLVNFHDTFRPAEQPPFAFVAFEALVMTALQHYDVDELKHWLRHGRAPADEAGKKVVERLPRTLAGTLARLLERPRLAGARGFVAQLTSALTLPPRRLVRQEMPSGGYADVTTRGHVEQLLPSQFALDDLDFLRRFAENELLFFRREEPQARTRHERIVLLDQGVRTWGDVRLVLSAAALALGRQAAAQGIRFLLATTGEEGTPVEPLEEDPEALGRMVEASDLSANPGLALERVLEQPADGDRDIVLLTHPRNLAEEDVTAAARRLAGGDRLFAVTLDGAGAVELAELRRGAPIRLRQFRVELTRIETIAEPEPDRVADAGARWKGSVEPLGFPFRFGPGSGLKNGLFDLEWAGDWLLAVGQGGTLHVWRARDGESEVLPRPMHNGVVFDSPEAVVGVVGGFVVGGRLGERLVAAHYDFVRRTCAVHMLGGDTKGAWQWPYSPEHHAIIAVTGPSQGYALDLASGVIYAPPMLAASRAKDAWTAWESGKVLPRWLPTDGRQKQPDEPHFHVAFDTGAVTVAGVTPPWQSFVPLADGRPALQYTTGLVACCRGQTLALCVRSDAVAKRNLVLHLFRGPEGIPLGEHPLHKYYSGFTLSGDGTFLARQVHEGQVEVRQVSAPRRVFVTPRGGHPQNVDVVLARGAMLIVAGKHQYHIVCWEDGRLQSLLARHIPGVPVFRHPETGRLYDGQTAAKGLLLEAVAYDPQRFTACTWVEVQAVVDRFGHVLIFDFRERLVCMFFALHGVLGAWMPDGTRLGPAWLTGGPPTPDAAARIGAALWEASAWGRVMA